MQNLNLNYGMKNFKNTDVTAQLIAYEENLLTADERLELELKIKQNPHYQEILAGIKWEKENKNFKPKYTLKMWPVAAAILLLMAFTIGIKQYLNKNRLKNMMPIENGLPVFMNAPQTYDQVMNAINTNNYISAMELLNHKPSNDTTLYFKGYCSTKLGNTDKALLFYNQVSTGYYREKANLWMAYLFITNNQPEKAKSILTQPLYFADLEAKRNQLLNYISE
jgi:hypothetical protein